MSIATLSADRTRIVLFVAGCIVLVWAARFTLRSLEELGRELRPTTGPDLPEISLGTGLKFPEGAFLVGSQVTRRPGGQTLWARVGLPRAQSPALAAAIPSPHRPARGLVRNSQMVPPAAWWDPQRVRDLLEVSWDAPGGGVAGVLLSNEDAHSASVHVVWEH